jgi:hypothetical protein
VLLTGMTITFLREFWLVCGLPVRFWLSLAFRHYGVGTDRGKEGAVNCV